MHAPPATSEGIPDVAGIDLPSDFTFGVSTAAYQIEGAITEDGRGRSVWDDFCDVPGNIVDGSSGAVACDSYHRYRDDVQLLRQLGVGAYRFSVAWPRVMPDGAGAVNPAGLDYYDRLVDELVGAGIAPAATLFHWDLPSRLQDAGGWTVRDTAQRFAEYAAVVADRLADRVALWFPVNEPNIVTTLGHVLGVHAPGMRLGWGGIQVAHHLLLGHGLAVAALRSAGAAQVGCANNHSLIWPASSQPPDVAAASLFDDVFNRLYSDSMLLGRYPHSVLEHLLGPVQEDLKAISAPLDFYGVNSYNPLRVGDSTTELARQHATDHPDEPQYPPQMPFAQLPIAGYPATDFGWPVAPDAFRDLFIDLRDRYPEIPPIYVTENGCSHAQGPDGTGAIPDQFRVDFLAQHLDALAQARAAGVPVRGYFAWSLLDNFEWARGYTQRFGLAWMDYPTSARTPKDSFAWYASLIAATTR